MRVSAGNASVTVSKPVSRVKGHFFAAGFAAAMVLGGAAQAESYNFGKVDVSVATTLSAGISIRASERDCENVSPVNGGCTRGDGRATGINSDNGNLNFDQGDLTDAIVRATMDIQAKYENYGVFLRPTAFYNQVYAKNNMEFRDLSHNGREQLQYGIDLLDAFVYGDFEIAGHYTTIRVGNQVLNWGESLFIQGGMNQFQAIDVTAIRTPGSELKDALTPMPMIYASIAATDLLTLEAFWQFDYTRTEVDPAGSFYSGNDIVGRGSLPALLNATIDNPDLFQSAQVPIALQRSEDRGASNMNQFGAAAHYYAEDLGTGTDFGLYFVRYSSRLPFLAFQNGNLDIATACSFIAPLDANCGTPASGNPLSGSFTPNTLSAFAAGASAGKYYYDFPTVETLGGSFSTTLEGVAVSGEVTFSPNMPFGVSDNELNASQLDGTGATLVLTGAPTASSYLNGVGVGQSTISAIRLDAWQGQIGTISSFATTDLLPRTLGADSGAFVFNGGFVYVPDAGDYPLNHSGRIGGIKSPVAGAIFGGARNPQYATSFSAGYVTVATVSYNNALGTSLTVSPSVALSHDLVGYAPGPITAGYIKGVKRLSLGVSADYQSKIRTSLSYTNSFGGGTENTRGDRDFVAASIRYSF